MVYSWALTPVQNSRKFWRFVFVVERDVDIIIGYSTEVLRVRADSSTICFNGLLLSTNTSLSFPPHIYASFFGFWHVFSLEFANILTFCLRRRTGYRHHYRSLNTCWLVVGPTFIAMWLIFNNRKWGYNPTMSKEKSTIWQTAICLNGLQLSNNTNLSFPSHMLLPSVSGMFSG